MGCYSPETLHIQERPLMSVVTDITEQLNLNELNRLDR